MIDVIARSQIVNLDQSTDTKINNLRNEKDSDIAGFSASISGNATAIREEFAAADVVILGLATEAIADVEADTDVKIAAHKASTTDHPAENIPYTGSVTGANQVKGALDSLKSELDQAIAGVTVDSEVINARQSARKNITFDTLDARLEAAELDSSSAGNAALFIREATAALVREQTPSGIQALDVEWASTKTKSLAVNENRCSLVNSLYSTTQMNAFQTKSFVAFINGYRVNLNDGTNAGLEWIFDDPPTSGERWDLGFIEMWFVDKVVGDTVYKNGYRGTGEVADHTCTYPERVVEWRKRKVAGVDFGVYVLDGFTKDVTTLDAWTNNNQVILAQGGNISVPSINYYSRFACNKQRNDTGIVASKIALSDTGLYIAGNGNSDSKSTLATADGYVYAIPMFKVRRRNNAGYSAANPCGARDYFTVTTSASDVTGMSVGLTTTFTLVSTTGIVVGDVYMDTSYDRRFRVDSILSATQVIVTIVKTNGGVSVDTFVGSRAHMLTTPSPSALYSNIIDKSDIVWLAHNVSLTGFDYRTLQAQVVESLFTNNLTTKAGKTMLATYHGVPKSVVDEYTACYASLDGSLTAENGTLVTNITTPTFKPCATGMGVKLEDGKYIGCAIPAGQSAITVEAWFNTEEMWSTGSNLRYILSINTGGNIIGIAKTTAVNFDIFNGNGANRITNTFIPKPISLMTHVSIRVTTSRLDIIINGVIVYTTATVLNLSLMAIAKIGEASATYGYIGTISDFHVSLTDRGTSYPQFPGSVFPADISQGYARVVPAFTTQRQYFSDALTGQTTSSVAKADDIDHDLGISRGVVGTGTKQVETATVVGDITTPGNAVVTVTSANMGGSPKTVEVNVPAINYLINGNFLADIDWIKDGTITIASGVVSITANNVNTCIRESNLWVDNAKSAHKMVLLYTVVSNTLSSGGLLLGGLSGNDFCNQLSLTSTVGKHARVFTVTDNAGTDDQISLWIANMVVSGTIVLSNIALIDLTEKYGEGNELTTELQCLTAFPNWFDQTPASTANLARTALSLDPDIKSNFTVSGTGADVVLTDRARLANDATLNIAIDNGTCTGLTAAPVSASTTAGVAGVWSASDTIKVKGAAGEVVSGVIDGDTASCKIIEDVTGTSPIVMKVDDVSKLAVSDTLQRVDIRDNSISVVLTITSVDVINKTITVSWVGGGSLTCYAGYHILVETTASTSVPISKFSLVTDKTAQGGASTYITLQADASAVDDYYNGFYVKQTEGPGAGQNVLITDYEGATKKAYGTFAVSPTSASKYNIEGRVAGTWSNLGTNEATFTLSATNGLTNQDIWIDYSLNQYAGQGAITEFATETLQGEVKGKKMVPFVTGVTPFVRDDFTNKISGSVVECPHVIKISSSGVDEASVLKTPVQFVSELWNSGGYDRVTQLNNVSASASSFVNGQIPQLLNSINLIRLIEDKHGPIPAVDKVQWIKDNTSKIIFNWWGYGSCPVAGVAGNKAYVVEYLPGLTVPSYDSPASTNLTGVIAKVSRVCVNLQYRIDKSGFIHFIAYTDAADGTTGATTLRDVAHALLVGDLIENTTRALTGFITTVSDANHVIHDSITGQVATDSIKKFHKQANGTAEVGTTAGMIKITAHGLSTGDWIRNTSRGNALRKVTVIDADFLDVDDITDQTAGDTIEVYTLYATITASAGIASTIYTDYCNVEVELKVPTGYDCLVPDNPRRDDWAVISDDYLGKVAGSLVGVSHVAREVCHADLQIPGIGTEFLQDDYDNVSLLNAVCKSTTTSVAGERPQQTFDIDVIRQYEDTYGPIPKTTRKKKAQWFNENMYKFILNWTGYGSCPSGNKAYVDWHYKGYPNWFAVQNSIQSSYSNASNTPASIVISRILSSSTNTHTVDDQGYIHFLAYTDASDGVTPSTIYTDYIKLDIYMKPMIIPLLIRKETKEISTYFPARPEHKTKSWVNYIPYQGLTPTTASFFQNDVILSDLIAYVSSLGTGAYVNTPYANYKGLISRLPINVGKDYDLIAQDITINGLLSKLLKVDLLPQQYSTSEISQFIKILSSSAVPSVNQRGVNSNALLSTGLTFSPNFKIKNTIIVNGKTQNILAFLVLRKTDNKIYLVIVSTTSSSDNQIFSFNSSSSCDIYEVIGRPLCRQ